MKLAKIIVGIVFFAVLASNVLSISRWSESRGVYDDVCYLRQAHLFQHFGLAGLDTDVSKDDDPYLARKLREIGHVAANETRNAPCHSPMTKTKKISIQYPPGTGAVLALFPEGFQVIPLYVVANIAVFAFALVALLQASTPPSLALAAAFGLCVIYMMINPTKASYSMAPTMMICAGVGLLSARLFSSTSCRERLWLAMAVGLILGLSATFRIANLLLSTGYCIFFLGAFLRARSRQTFLEGFVFGVAFVIGTSPMLAANWINAGSPFTTTYTSIDVMPPDLDFSVLRAYLVDLQFFLLIASVAWTAMVWRMLGLKQAVLVVMANLIVNIAFFITHPVFTPYYVVPIAMLSSWTLLFVVLTPRAAVADNRTVARPAGA
jgi:hypothetical protein